MSYENSMGVPRSPYPANYEAATDQITFEHELRVSFAERYPDENPLLERLLAITNRICDLAGPMDHLTPDMFDPATNPLPDNNGTMNLIDPFTLEVPLKLPRDINKKTFDNENQIVGEIPPSTDVMIEEFYKLTGASIVASGYEDGPANGNILFRQATYMGKTFYICEFQFNAKDVGIKDPALTPWTLTLYSAETAKAAIDSLHNQHQTAEQVKPPKLSGILSLFRRK